METPTLEIALNLEELEYLFHLMMAAQSFRSLPTRLKTVHKDSYQARLIALNIKLSTAKTILAARMLGQERSED